MERPSLSRHKETTPPRGAFPLPCLCASDSDWGQGLSPTKNSPGKAALGSPPVLHGSATPAAAALPVPGDFVLRKDGDGYVGGRMVAGQGLGPKPGSFWVLGLLEQQRPLGRRNNPGGRDCGCGASRAPAPQSFLLVIHPLPHPQVVFTQFFCFPSFTPVPDCGGGGGTGRGVSGGCLSLVAFQNPRLSLAHLSFSFATFSALGSGCISKKLSPWAGRGAHQVELLPSWHTPPPPPSFPCGAPTTMVSSFAEAAGTES